MRTDTFLFKLHNTSLNREPRFVIEVAFDSANIILVYFTSHADVALPGGGQVVSSVIERLSGTSQSLNADQANSTIGDIDFDFVDYGSIITTTLGTQLALGRSTRLQRVRVYMGLAGDVWADYSLIQTQLVTEISFLEGMYTIKCQDIQREMRKDIFVQAVTNLASTLAASELTSACSAAAGTLNVRTTADFPASGVGVIRDSSNDGDLFSWAGKTATTLTGCTGVLAHTIGATVCDATINVVATSAFELVPHGTSYSDAPSATVGYVRVEDEICRYTSKTSTTFVCDMRGAINTRAVPHAVDAGTAAERRTQVKEYVYLELPSIDLMYRVLTGKDRLGNVVMPLNWHLGISTDYVRLSDFTDPSKVDLWDINDAQQGFIVRFEDMTKMDGKKFIETELALLSGVFMPIYADGALGCKRMANILAGAAYEEILDETNTVSCGPLINDYTSLHNIIEISWNWEPLIGDFTRINAFFDQPSITVHKKGVPLRLQFRGLHGSRHSASMLASRFDALRDRYTGPPLRHTVNVLGRLNGLQVGEVVRNKQVSVRDFVANGTLDRSFEIQNIRIDWTTGALGLQLFASSRAPSPLPATGDAIVLPHAWYISQGTQVVNGTGGLTLTGTNPIHISGTGTLAGNASMANAGAIYYIVGDVQIDAGAVINLSQNVQLRIEGNVQNNGVINGKGAGLAGAPAKTSAGVYTYYGIMTNDQNLGTPGFIGSTEAGGGVSTTLLASNRDNSLLSVRSAIVVGANAAVPAFNLIWDGVTLDGMPVDLRGTSGSSGMSSSFLPYGEIGGAGGAGGAGLCITCRGFAQGVAGKIDLSGADGLPGQFDSGPHQNNGYAGSGAGGAPGGLAIFLDGAGVTATGLTDNGFVALYGKTPVPPATAEAVVIRAVLAENSSISRSVSSYYVGTGDGTTGNGGSIDLPLSSLSGGRGGSRVQYVPGNQTIVIDPVAATLPMPTSLGLASGTSELLLSSDGTVTTRVKVTWNPVNDSRVVGYDLQFKRSADAIWQSAPSVLGQGADTAWVVGINDGTQYDFRVRAASSLREVSDWATISAYTVLGKTVKPTDVGTLTFTDTLLSWTAIVDADRRGYIVRYQVGANTDWPSAIPGHKEGFITPTQFDTSGIVGGSTTLLVKSVDTSGNESTTAASLLVDLRPPVPTGFTVTRQPDGTRELAWILASPPSDLDGFRIKWFLGSTSDWTAMTLLHSGVLKASPFESNQLAAGTYTFAIKSVDKAGNESATALFITSLTIGDPRIAGSIEDFLEEPFWTETKTNAIVDGATGWLVASGSGSWNTTPTTWDTFNGWIVTPSGSIQYERKIDVGLITTFTPLVTVVVDSAGGSVVIEEAHSNVDSGYSAFAAVGPELLTRWIKIRVTVTGTFPKLKSERIILSATPIEEIINDLSTSTLTGAYDLGVGNVRLPITKVYNVIKKVDVTLQSVGAGWSWELIDKNTSVGPQIKIYNASNVLADALIDATIKGV